MDKLKKVMIFIPAFNEEASIVTVIDKVQELYPEERTRLKGYIIEILVVNDGSQDKTEEIVLSKNVALISHPKNLGLGAATRTGMETAYEMGADAAVKLDADFQHDPEDIEKVIIPLLENKADICWGSRFAGHIEYKMPFTRYVGNHFFTWLMNRLTDYDISDAQTGLMAYGRKYLAVFELHGNYNPPQQLLMDANYKHMRYAEVPVVFHERTKGESFVSLKYPFKVIPNMIRVMIFANPMKIFGCLGLLMILLSLSIVSFWTLGALLDNPSLQHIPILSISNLALILFISGLQTLFFGILADLIVKKRK
ncbi:MAG: glycosyltransferase family 2 protein [Deltaproteobacteria bacterium]|nr:glycosyltransferase family 2 protein [Deltaproteobacteria bacterium]